MRTLWLFLSVFVTFQCDIGQNDDGICKITSSVFCFLVNKPASGNNIAYIK